MATDTAHHVPPEEIRFGVILNGGVSLAVWMGGAVLELDCLVKASRSKDGVYGGLLDLAGCTARVDVISGTSAGGINGAALALAQANELAVVGDLRDIWVDSGQIETLLRRPFRGSPTSLLQGDEYFLPELNKALTRLAVPVRGTDAPLDLTITTTVLRGNQTVHVDSMGQRLPQRVHAGRFHWTREVRRGDGSGRTFDPFDGDHIADTARHLALAARCTASFPVAFEPVFVPVDRPGLEGLEPRSMTEDQRLRPDMSCYVEEWGDERPARDRSRYVVDGGVLANTPTKAALEAVESMDPQGPVRRVMLMVYPHAGEPGSDPADDPDTPPTLTGAVSGLLGALTAQGGRTFVEEFERHNRTAAGRRGTRQDVLDSFVAEEERERASRADADADAEAEADVPTVCDRLAALATAMLPQYRRLRRWRAGRDVARRAVDVVVAARDVPVLGGDWDYERVRRAAEGAQESWEKARSAAQVPGRPYLPYVPDRVDDGLEPGATTWGWGAGGALGVVEAAGDLTRRLVWMLESGDAYDRVVETRVAIAEAAKKIAETRDLVDDVWCSDALLELDLMPTQAYWTLRLAWYERLMLGVDDEAELMRYVEDVAQVEAQRRMAEGRTDEVVSRLDGVRDGLREHLLGPQAPTPGAVGATVHGIVTQVLGETVALLPVLVELCARNEAANGLDESSHALASWQALLTDAAGEPVRETELLRRLLTLEVVASSLGDEVTTGATLPVELVQLSAQTGNGFAKETLTADDKLGGMSVNRFGGFLKRSWRVNDWTWGRVDAATILIRTVLQPARLRRAAAIRGQLVDDPDAGRAAERVIGELLGELVLTTLRTDPRARVAYDRAVRELRDVYSLQVEQAHLSAAMPGLAELCAWARHLEVVAAELPALAKAVEADRVDGASARSNGEVLLAQHDRLIADLEKPPVADPAAQYADRMAALRVFDRAGVGRESLQREASSDQTIRTATTAAAVATTVADSDRSGLGAAKPVTRLVRGGMQLPYWVVTALSSGAVVARSLALLGLAVGGVLLALSLFGVLPEALAGPGAAVGAAAVLVVFAYSALRTGTLLHGLVLLTPVAALLAFAAEKALRPPPRGQGAVAEQQEAAQDAAAQGAAALVVVLVLVLALMVLGSLPASQGSVWAALDRTAKRHGVEVPEWDDPGARHTWPERFRMGARRALARAEGVGRSLAAALVPVVALGVLALAVVWAVQGWSWWLVERLQDNVGWYAVGAILAVAAGGFLAWRLGSRLQVLRRHGGTVAPGSSPWVTQALAHPAGTAVGWAVLYGAGYLLLAGLMLLEPWGWLEQAWGRAVLIIALLLGVVLVLVVPWWVPLRTIRAVERDTLERLARPTVRQGEVEAEDAEVETELVRDLFKRGEGFRWLFDPDAVPDPGSFDTTGGRARHSGDRADYPPLRKPRGTRLAGRLQERRAGELLALRQAAERSEAEQRSGTGA